MNKIRIGKKFVSENLPTYFIADIASNHDGSLSKAKELIHMAAESGADAAKFQNFYAKTLVSDYGFKNLKNLKSHQSKWKKSVFNTYKQNEVPLEWTQELAITCKKFKIEYMTAPYDENIIHYLNDYVDAWKVGSGDITWHENILKMAKTKKPIIIATGASNFYEIQKLYKKVEKVNNQICLMQCNTNYTGSKSNFKYINLSVLKNFKIKFKDAILGLSDHTPGHETVLGAVTLGARIIEKHFTDNNKNMGPDHKFSMNPKTWSKMVNSTRNLEMAIGSAIKKVEKNEINTSILQRRSIRVNKDLIKGQLLKKSDLEYLRPCPRDAIPPYDAYKIINKKIIKNIKKSRYLKYKYFKKIV
jgi:N-acetylneuraminate synthase